MSDTKHTPGPWQIATSKGHKSYVYGADNQPVFVPNVSATNRNKLEMEANARLIAAAPDLLETARVFSLIIPSDLPDDRAVGQIGGVMIYAGEIRRLTAAIAKAEGKQ